MRLSWSASVSETRGDQRLGNSRARKKHKRLDAICDKMYSQCHSHGGVKIESSECNAGSGSVGDESELRRSTRVRRAPVVLDVLPPPAKKRQCSGGSVGKVKSESPCSTSREMEGELGSLGVRLRSRTKNGKFGKMGNSSPRGKKKLFLDFEGFTEKPKLEVGEGLEGGRSTVVKLKRPGRIKASKFLRNGHQDIDLGSVRENGQEKNEVESGNEGEVKGITAVIELLEDKESEVPTSLHVQHIGRDEQLEQSSCVKDGENYGNIVEDCIANVSAQHVEWDKQLEQQSCVNDGENQRKAVEVGGCDLNLEDKIFKKVDKINYTIKDELARPRIKEGMRCSLCGGGADGKPLKKLVHDGTGSDNEAYCGSSASEEPNYDIWDGFGDEPGWLGRLFGPIKDRNGIARYWVHQNCAVWSPEVYFAGLGRLKNVRAALCRGRVLKCSQCGRPGATVGCRVDRCPKTYHLPCARANGCVFDHRKFLIACTLHRKLFQPHGSKYLYRLKRKKMKLEMRKMSNDSCRRDLEAEEKWLENCGEDEEFLKRESKRLHRDLLRVTPVYIGGSKSESETQFQGWESVAGLQEVIQCLKEVVILPLLYPDFFNNMGLTPPRGVLLHGCPGTGKTLVVRALIGSCARGDKRIAYFARKGADCLGKYVGDAERQLRLLFQVAEKSQPSIIFFDEIDGLAPPRTRHQDQTHSSVVSTLLALMDGLKSRGSVVVIGATNRPEAVDPALRRPGRFDREIYFPLPSVKDREAILSLQTQKWPNPVTGSLLKWIARRTVGFAGADLQALCTQAAIIALKRSCPLQKLLSAAEEKVPHGRRPSLPTFTVEDRDWMEAISCGPPPCSRREAGTAASDVVSSPLPAHLVHCLLQSLCNFLVSFYLDERVWWPTLSKAVTLIKDVIVSTLDKKKLQNVCWWSHVHDLLQEVDVASEIESKLSCASILVGDDSFHGFDAVDDDTSDGSVKFEPSLVDHRGSSISLLRNGSYISQKKSGFRILISGNPRTGQRHLASCILHCFVGNAEIRKVDLATIQQEGHGDVIQGVTQILMRCSSVGSCMIFMPKIDLWAVEACYQVSEEKIDYPSEELESSKEKKSCFTQSEVFNKENNSQLVVHTTETAESQDTALEASCIWNSFVEQTKSICVSTSLMILATSEVPFQLLPFSIRQFFRSGVMNCSHSTPLMDTVPRFSIQIEGNFNREIVIDSSAAKLSKDLARHFVELAHHRTHIFVESSFEEDKAWDELENEADGVCQNLDCASPVMRVLLPPSKRNIKGKSSLLLAISTFGYQILQYPHFAELCWVTSKLKEGPCADINGPWKGWPFNSCITRRNGSLETVTIACSSSNFKSKEKYGLVRGLIAVGLSAYRGMYTSLSEVSCEVRKVLEILARKVKAKIKGGKDRYQFTHLLSQAANLQDMVNSWACTLQSLEADAQLGDANPKLTCERFLDTCDTCKGLLVQSNGCKSDVSNKIPHELEVLKKDHLFDAKNNQLDVKLLNAHNKATSERTEVDGDFGYSKHPNGYTCIDSAVLHGDGPCGSGDLGGVIFSTTRKECNLVNSLSSSYKNVDINHSSNQTTGLVCLHYCCSECLYNLHRLIEKILIRECGRKGSSWVVEDIHDIVSSISASLHLAICQAESSINKNPNHNNYKVLFQDLKMGTCRCKNSGNRLITPVECSCHSRSKSRKAQHRLDLELVYKDGLLAVIDPEEHVSFHCKFNSFCLCSLLEMIVLTVQPLD